MNNELGFMSIGLFRFKVLDAVLVAKLRPDMFFWTLRIQGEGMADDELLRPIAYSDNLLPLFNRQLHAWHDAIANSITWEKAYHPKSNAPLGCLQVYSHEDIDEAELTFGKPSGAWFDLQWRGISDVSSERFDMDDDDTFIASTRCFFKGVNVRGFEERDELQAIREFIHTGEFRLKETLADGSNVYELV